MIPQPPQLPPPPPLLSVKAVHNYVYTDVICHMCPYGGTCRHGIQTKANYWGLQQNGIVSFYKCPSGYCCSQVTCTTYNVCQNHRSGILCSKCKTGYSEVLFSPSCIPDEECKQFWFIPVAVLMLLMYALFLMYQNDIKTYVFGSPIGVKTFYQWVSTWSSQREKQLSKDKEKNQGDDDGTNFTDRDEGGIFLILIFHYFQDAAIVNFTPVYSKPTAPIVIKLKKFVGSLFKFQFDPLMFAENLCPLTGLNQVTKVLFKLLSIPFLLLTLITVCWISKVCSRPVIFQKYIPTFKKLAHKSSLALMLALLFSYQKLASSVFSLVCCVPLADDSVLFIDGSVECLQGWQILILIYIVLCIVPFGFYTAIVPKYLSEQKISIGMFFLGCMFPVPLILIIMLKKAFNNLRKSNGSDKRNNADTEYIELSLVYRLLQGPYRNYHLPIPFIRTVAVCWNGILLLIKLMLVIAHTYIHDILVRLLVMTLISFLSLLHHLMVKPWKENRANIAGSVSCTVLLSVCIINLVRATLEVVEVVPEGQLKNVMDTLESIEDCLLVWIPLAGASVLIIFLLARTIMGAIVKCNSLRNSVSQPLSGHAKSREEIPSNELGYDSANRQNTAEVQETSL